MERNTKRKSKYDIKKVINDWTKYPTSSNVPLLILNNKNIDYYSLIKIKINSNDKFNFNYDLITNTNIPRGLPILGPNNYVYNIQSEIGPYKKKFWRFIRLTNPFELVNTGKGRHSVIDINTINRAYFKMIELLHNFNLINNDEPLSYAALAEGPGGFIQAIIDYRNKYNCDDDTIWGITLKNDKESSTKWNKSLNSKFKVNYGDPNINDGNLLNPLNIIAYSKLFDNNKADLVTADGGFFVPPDLENFKEQLHVHLFLCEIITALKIQKNGGNFILKIYDIFTKATVQLLSILNSVYDEVFITKPVTSRPANSEKYIVCMNFQGMDDDNINNLLEISNKLWINKSICNNEPFLYIDSIFNDEIPNNIINSGIEINKILLGYKIKHVQNTLKLTKKFTGNNTNNDEFRKIQSQALIKQKKIAKSWANKYNIPIKK